MDNLFLALDFGGTKLSAALFVVATSVASYSEDATEVATTNPRLLDLRRAFTPPDADSAYEMAAIVTLAREMLDGRVPAAVGAGFGGPVDHERGIVRLSHHVGGWENMPLREALEREFGAPAAIDNDANTAALGEYRFGAGRGVSDLMYLTVSTGVGGGWVLGGRTWRGHDGMAGEIGHTVADPAGPLCLCGKRGCVERLASGPYMAADAEALLRADPDAGPILRELWSSAPRELTGRMVAEAAAAGDELALAILMRGARALGVGIGNAANLVNPQRFILGGGVTKAGEIWWAEVRRAARMTALPQIHFDIVPAELGDDAPLWGAVALVT